MKQNDLIQIQVYAWKERRDYSTNSSISVPLEHREQSRLDL